MNMEHFAGKEALAFTATSYNKSPRALSHPSSPPASFMTATSSSRSFLFFKVSLRAVHSKVILTQPYSNRRVQRPCPYGWKQCPRART